MVTGVSILCSTYHLFYTGVQRVEASLENQTVLVFGKINKAEVQRVLTEASKENGFIEPVAVIEKEQPITE